MGAVEVSTGSGSDRVSIHATFESAGNRPVPLGTDLITQLHPRRNWEILCA